MCVCAFLLVFLCKFDSYEIDKTATKCTFRHRLEHVTKTTQTDDIALRGGWVKGKTKASTQTNAMIGWGWFCLWTFCCMCSSVQIEYEFGSDQQSLTASHFYTALLHIEMMAKKRLIQTEYTKTTHTRSFYCHCHCHCRRRRRSRHHRLCSCHHRRLLDIVYMLVAKFELSDIRSIVRIEKLNFGHAAVWSCFKV